MKTLIKNSKGFSLIELMIVVAIIGILSAIAIPNFQKFQRKAKQTEAKALLSAYYTAAKAAVAEWDYNPGNFVAVGYAPEGLLGYAITAADGANPPGLLTVTTNEDTCLSTLVAGCTNVTWANKPTANNSGPVTVAGANNGAQTFITTAGGQLGTASVDSWTINETKTLTNTVSGL